MSWAASAVVIVHTGVSISRRYTRPRVVFDMCVSACFAVAIISVTVNAATKAEVKRCRVSNALSDSNVSNL